MCSGNAVWPRPLRVRPHRALHWASRRWLRSICRLPAIARPVSAIAGRGEFLEHARVFDNFYGTGLRAVQSDLRDGQLLLLEIDWQGARQVRARLPAAPSIFILPPTRRALEERLRARSTDSEAVIERRLKDAAQDLAHWSE